MSGVSNPYDTLTILFDAEGLDPPAVVAWPLDDRNEASRAGREKAFLDGLGRNPPPGLDWIKGHREAKYRPDRILAGCRSVLVTYLPYYRNDPIDEGAGIGQASRESRGRVARYARGRDYHKELGGRLKRLARRLGDAFSGHAFRPFTDIGPLDETWLAEASGMAFTGRHTLSIVPEAGSWVVLGHILSTLPLDAVPGRPSPVSCPPGCRRCIDACPTEALSMPGMMDAASCISYQTIEHVGPVDGVFRGPTAQRLFGCDACQEACPFNFRVRPTTVEAFRRDVAGASPDLGDVLSIRNHEDMVRRFAGSPLMRAGRHGLVRNACTAAGNSGDRRLLPALEKLAGSDEDAGIREHAAWAIRRLGSSDSETADE